MPTTSQPGSMQSLNTQDTSDIPEEVITLSREATFRRQPMAEEEVQPRPSQLLNDNEDLESVTQVVQDERRHEVSEHSSVSEQSSGLPTSNETPGMDVGAEVETQHELNGSSRLSWKESLGTSGLFFILGGHGGTVAILIFLTFIWFGHGQASEGVSATHTWRRLALNGWIPQAVTLCALALRVTISQQSAVCTAMIAALVLERRSTKKSHAAYFSVARGFNDGPMKLLRMMLVPLNSQYLQHAEFWLLLVLTTVTIGLQFTSTILLSDLHNFVMVGDLESVQVPSLVRFERGDFIIRNVPGQYQNSAPVYMALGEEQHSSDTTPSSHGLSDTGVIKRGFLPFPESSNRTSVRYFEGNAMIMSSRVACMRPNISSKISYYDDQSPYVAVTGLLRYALSLSEAHASDTPPCSNTNCQETYFQCNLPYTYDRGNWETVPCILDPVGGAFRNLSMERTWSSSDEPWIVNSSIHLVFATNMTSPQVAQLFSDDHHGAIIPYQEWNNYEFMPGVLVNSTLCFSAFNMERKSVRMSSSGPLEEPVIDWLPTSLEYNASQVRTYMGVDRPRKSHEDRGILAMSINGPPDDGPPESLAHRVVQFLDSNLTISDLTSAVQEVLVTSDMSYGWLANTTVLTCDDCQGFGQMIHPLNGMLFTEIINTTNRAADAIQSHLTVVAMSVYETYLNTLEETQEALVSTTRTVLAPGLCSANSCAGFVSVATLVVVQMICVMTITTIFVRNARHSFYNNIWHTISQLANPELRDILEKTTNSGDKAIKKLIQKDDYRVRLVKTPQTGEIGIVRIPASSATSSALEKPPTTGFSAMKKITRNR
ncbi:hypothetical protein PFICI_00279 [Pestalotiopsis fici W106-1]|uniref:Transmembrane protein n=1 Tax=Pestalotiopsis fici (strain W106-1 / CGMCC3.15140) TaxID=1229662 RepID=W3XME8_PESFW|nr:uncharacterized protein PFICI_00279 [Pestalotiopsis fici W106-1]ETS86451.1 hypothetical protein PFICI_00279 [Pestalotiopsis fici W106-1]